MDQSKGALQIGILSDTHGYLDDELIQALDGCDQIWHAGDIGAMEVIDRLRQVCPEVKAVYGNIDPPSLRRVFPEVSVFDVDQVKVVMLHIAGYPGKYTAQARQLLKQHRPQLLVCGHSHILKIVRDPRYGHLHINPGAAGREGFHKVRTIVRFGVIGERLVDVRVHQWDR